MQDSGDLELTNIPSRERREVDVQADPLQREREILENELRDIPLPDLPDYDPDLDDPATPPHLIRKKADKRSYHDILTRTIKKKVKHMSGRNLQALSPAVRRMLDTDLSNASPQQLEEIHGEVNRVLDLSPITPNTMSELNQAQQNMVTPPPFFMSGDLGEVFTPDPGAVAGPSGVASSASNPSTPDQVQDAPTTSDAQDHFLEGEVEKVTDYLNRLSDRPNISHWRKAESKTLQSFETFIRAKIGRMLHPVMKEQFEKEINQSKNTLNRFAIYAKYMN